MNANEQLLLEDLKNLFPNFNCTLQDLRNPSEEFVTNFYTFLLSEFEVNITTIPQIQFSQTQVSNVSLYADTYSSTIPKLNLLQAVRALNVVPDFGILDIVSPTPRRIQAVIRAFCEFYNWCDERIGSMIDMKKEKKIHERKKLLANMVEERQNLQEQLNNVFKVIGQIQDVKKELEGEMNELQQRSTKLRLEMEMFKTKSEEVNEKTKEKEAILHKIIKEETQISNKIKDHSNQIVNSPTLILTDLETLREKDKEMKSLSEQKRDMVETKMKAQKTVEEELGWMEGRSNQLDEVLKLLEHHRKLLKLVTKIERQTINFQEDLKEVKSTLMTIMSKKSMRHEELQALILKWKNTKNQLTQSLEAIKSELNSEKNVKDKMFTGLKEDEALENQINSITDQINAHAKAFEEEYAKILNQEDLCLERLKKEGLKRAERIKADVKKVLKREE